ncbi:hypothetical protein J8L98_22530 [Pseudoalteromonas sp. MMG013]|uniref:hypothetical protein n=1 Tax=Pseudoalteromonas sp. MMG013 TaxID=2822687 RepID=UPI001B3946CC|nr:hypothetical protein [Pseudoalteromonas sp. MMG013]MBQ4864472.1 hypothetical protein [Pseudoalteromonas sp. MMG013]
MTIENGLTQLQVDVAELTDESVKLANSVTRSLATIDAVKGDIQNTHNFVDSNYQALNDWQTKHGTVTFKNLQGQNKQVNTLSKLILDSEKINPNPHVMSKAQFDALRELRKQQYAGSGFVEWGKHWAGSGADGTVNEGLWPYFKEMRWGRRNNVSDAGSSHAAFPIAVIDGVSHNIKGTALNATEAANNIQIQFPPAPNGTKTYDSATGVVTKHASAAEAFEGEVGNGDFRLGDDGKWRGTGPNWTIENGVATKTSTLNTSIFQENKVTAGVTYRVEVVIDTLVGTLLLSLGDAGLTSVDAKMGFNSFELTAGSDHTDFFVSNGDSSGLVISSVSIMPVTESVITSRKDLVFLESWHETVSEKDLFVPLGNVQYGAASFGNGMALNKLTDYDIAQGYCAFGEWDTVTQGYGRRWSEMSEARKKEMIDNPENNIYFDSEVGELIQVRYRIRVVEGLGDDWGDVSLIGSSAINYSNRRFVAPQGKSTLSDDFRGLVNPLFYQNLNTNIASASQIGQLQTNSDRSLSETGFTTAIPIALVQRLNQGAYHPTYNPMGCKTWAAVGVSLNLKWHSNGAVGLINSTAHCFETENLGTRPTPTARSGYIGAEDADSGRSDQYKYYDAIYAGQVEDLRLNANKHDVNQLREETMRKAVAGTLRGKGKVPFTVVTDMGAHASVEYYANNATRIQFTENTVKYTAKSNRITRNQTTDTPYFGYLVGKTSGLIYPVSEAQKNESGLDRIYIPNYDYRTEAATESSGWYLVQGAYHNYDTKDFHGLHDLPTLPAEFDSLPWVDIIGDPERIAATFPDGVVGQWIPQIPDGSQLELNLNRKSEGSITSTLYTDNDALSWTSISTSVNGITNTITGTKPSTRVELHTYESPSNFTVSSSSTAVVGDVGDVYASQAHQVKYGNRLQLSLMGKVGKRSGGAYLQEFVSITKYSKYAPDGDLGWTSVIGDDPLHAPLSLDTPNDNSPAVKALSTVTEKDGLLYLQLHGAELKHTPRTIADMTVINAGSPTGSITKGHVYLFQGFDNALVNRPMVALVDHAGTTWNSSSYNGYTLNDVGEVMTNTGTKFTLIRSFDSHWGDDQVIPIVNGENVKTDLNGNTVKVFCHHTQIPQGIASN